MIIINSKIITWETPNRILEGYAVRISKGHIAEIALQHRVLELNPEEDTLDACGQFLMPGSICAHTHFYGAFSRGLGIPGDAPADFPEILNKLWWPLDQSLTREDVYYSTLVCLIDAIKHGTTTLFDHHASPNFIEGSLDVIYEAFINLGVRGMVCYEVTDRGGVEKAESGIAENVRMINKLKLAKRDEGLVKANFGLHASLTLSDQTLEKCRKSVPADTGFHIHIAEHQIDEFDSVSKTGMRVVDRLHAKELTGKKSIFVHGVHIDMQEAQIIKETGTWLTHQPRSNMNNAVGLPEVESLLRLGIPVCIGNDGFSNAMWDEWRTCYLAHKLWKGDPRRVPGNQVIEMGVYNNARLASSYFSNVGVIEEGALADLILVDYKPITEMNTGNLPWHILFGFRDSMVTSTIVAGKILMKDRVLLDLDEEKIFSEARNLSREVWQRYLSQFKEKRN